MLLLFRDYEFKSEEIKSMLINPSTGQLVKEGETYKRPLLAKTLGNKNKFFICESTLKIYSKI